MSTYMAETIHPISGNTELAMWIDDHFGQHHYGVMFLDGRIYDPRKTPCVQVQKNRRKERNTDKSI